MCRSLAEGGQRCASHTRPAYEAALVDYDHARRPDGPEAFTPPDGVDAATRLADAAAHYASTPEGAVRVGAEADARTGAGDVDTGALLGQAVQQGQRIRQAAQDTAGIVRGKGAARAGGTMYGARKLEAWEGKGVGVLAECGECDWSRVYPKASVRRSASHARRHYLSSHLTGADSGGATVETGTGTGAAGADAGGVDGGDIPKQLFQVTWFRADRHTHYGTYETGPFVNYVQGTSAAQVRKLFLTRSDGLVSRVKSVRSTESEYNARIIRAEARRNR